MKLADQGLLLHRQPDACAGLASAPAFALGLGLGDANQMTWMEERATSGGTLLLRVEEKYDALGRRIEEARWTSATGTVTTRFAYQGDNVWADLDGSNTLTVRYVRPDGVDALGARINAAGVASWYLTDRQGTVQGNTDASGALSNKNTYDGFGARTAQTNASASDRYLYTGRELQTDSGLQYTRARWYDTRTGSWTTIDPKGFDAGDDNLYRYVLNGPTNATDPTGQYLIAENEKAKNDALALLNGERFKFSPSITASATTLDSGQYLIRVQMNGDGPFQLQPGQSGFRVGWLQEAKEVADSPVHHRMIRASDTSLENVSLDDRYEVSLRRVWLRNEGRNYFWALENFDYGSLTANELKLFLSWREDMEVHEALEDGVKGDPEVEAAFQEFVAEERRTFEATNPKLPETARKKLAPWLYGDPSYFKPGLTVFKGEINIGFVPTRKMRVLQLQQAFALTIPRCPETSSAYPRTGVLGELPLTDTALDWYATHGLKDPLRSQPLATAPGLVADNDTMMLVANPAAVGFAKFGLGATLSAAARAAAFDLAVNAGTMWGTAQLDKRFGEGTGSAAMLGILTALAARKGLGKLAKNARVQKILAKLESKLRLKAPRTGTVLRGSTEHLVEDAALARSELARLQTEYTKATKGLTPKVVRGAAKDAWIDVETGQIFISDQVPPAFREGYLAEELHHYFQLQEKGLIGPGKVVPPNVEKALEADVLNRLRQSGFKPYNYRDYAPYTDVPRPPGVAGN